VDGFHYDPCPGWHSNREAKKIGQAVVRVLKDLGFHVVSQIERSKSRANSYRSMEEELDIQPEQPYVKRRYCFVKGFDIEREFLAEDRPKDT